MLLFTWGVHIYVGDTPVGVLIRLGGHLQGLIQKHADNGMNANLSKFQTMFLVLMGTNKLRLNMQDQFIPSNEHIKLLGVDIDNSFKFETHVKGRCRKLN